MQVIHEARPVVPRDRLLRIANVEAIAGVKKSTIYELMRKGQFPKCILITRRCAAWPETAVLQWVQDRIASAQAIDAAASAEGRRPS